MKDDMVSKMVDPDLRKRLIGNEPDAEFLKVIFRGEYAFRDQIGDFVTYKGLHKDDPPELVSFWTLAEAYLDFHDREDATFKEGINVAKNKKRLAVAFNKLMRRAYREEKPTICSIEHEYSISDDIIPKDEVFNGYT